MKHGRWWDGMTRLVVGRERARSTSSHVIWVLNLECGHHQTAPHNSSKGGKTETVICLECVRNKEGQ